jgi:hypothetical protein
MIILNGTSYRLCLLDTNAISELSKQPLLLGKFLTWCQSEEPNYVPCFSVFSLVELRRNSGVYTKFVESFRNIPCLLLKDHEHLLEEEVRCYPDFSEVEPVQTTFVGPEELPGDHLAEWLTEGFADESVVEQERQWNAEQDAIVEGIAAQVKNFPPSGSSYTPDDLHVFVELAGFGQIARRQNQFAGEMVAQGEAVDMEAFPSVKATTYTVFYKFYADRDRRPSRSDAFDIIISAGTPYVDAIVTENHQAEALRKTAKQNDFIRHLRVMTLRDMRQLP